MPRSTTGSGSSRASTRSPQRTFSARRAAGRRNGACASMPGRCSSTSTGPASITIARPRTPSATATPPTSAQRTPTRAPTSGLSSPMSARYDDRDDPGRVAALPRARARLPPRALLHRPRRSRPATCSASASASTASRGSRRPAWTAPACGRRCATSSSACSRDRDAVAVTRRARPRRSRRHCGRRARPLPRCARGDGGVARRGGGRGRRRCRQAVRLPGARAVRSRATATGRPAGGPAAEIAWRVGVDLARSPRICPQVRGDRLRGGRRPRAPRPRGLPGARSATPALGGGSPHPARLRARREPCREDRARPRARRRRASTSTTTGSSGSRPWTGSVTALEAR